MIVEKNYTHHNPLREQSIARRKIRVFLRRGLSKRSLKTLRTLRILIIVAIFFALPFVAASASSGGVREGVFETVRDLKEPMIESSKDGEIPQELLSDEGAKKIGKKTGSFLLEAVSEGWFPGM